MAVLITAVLITVLIAVMLLVALFGCDIDFTIDDLDEETVAAEPKGGVRLLGHSIQAKFKRDRIV